MHAAKAGLRRKSWTDWLQEISVTSCFPHDEIMNTQAYSEGWSAPEVMDWLREKDFVQSGGLVTCNAAAGGWAAEVNRELFVV